MMRPAREKVTTVPQESLRLFVRESLQFEYAWHYHPEYELTLICNSRGRRFVGDHISDYADGDLVLLGPNLPHTWCSDTHVAQRPHRAIVAHFSDSFVGNAIQHCPELHQVRMLLDRSLRGLSFTGPTRDWVAHELELAVQLSGLPCLVALLSILNRLATSPGSHPIASQWYTPPRDDQMNARIDIVCRYLVNHFTEPIQQAEVADLIGFSPAAFSRFFKRTTGKTFVSYLNELRIGHACRLLSDSRISITTVGFNSGYLNLSNFNRTFRRFKGVSPRQYRDAHQVER